MKLPFQKQKPLPVSRRRPPLEGSRPQAFSYHARRTEEEYNVGRAQPRQHEVRRRDRLQRYWRSRIGVAIALCVIVVCVFNILLLSNDPKIVILSTSSASASFLQSPATYEAAVQRLLKSSAMNGNKITVNTVQIADKLKAEYPELSDVSVALPVVGHRPVVYLSPATPSLILTTTDQQSYVLSQAGRVLTTAGTLSGSAQQSLAKVTDQSGLVVKPDDIALPSTDVMFIETVAAQLKAEHLTATSFVLPAATNELDVHFAAEHYFGKFNMYSGDAKQQVGTFVATVQYLASKHTTPGQYIDVRVDGRAYYK